MIARKNIAKTGGISFIFAMLLLMSQYVCAIDYPPHSIVSNRPEFISRSGEILRVVDITPTVLCIHHAIEEGDRLNVNISSLSGSDSLVIGDCTLSTPNVVECYHLLYRLLKMERAKAFTTVDKYNINLRGKGIATGYIYIDSLPPRKYVRITVSAVVNGRRSKDRSLFPYSRPKGMFVSQTLHKHVVYGRRAVLRTGTPQWPMSVGGNGTLLSQPNFGAYGLYYNIETWIYNEYRTRKALRIYVSPRGGNGAVLLQMSDNRLIGYPRLQSKRYYLAAVLTINPGMSRHSMRSYQISGANYPLDIVFTHEILK